MSVVPLRLFKSAVALESELLVSINSDGLVMTVVPSAMVDDAALASMLLSVGPRSSVELVSSSSKVEVRNEEVWAEFSSGLLVSALLDMKLSSKLVPVLDSMLVLESPYGPEPLFLLVDVPLVSVSLISVLLLPPNSMLLLVMMGSFTLVPALLKYSLLTSRVSVVLVSMVLVSIVLVSVLLASGVLASVLLDSLR